MVITIYGSYYPASEKDLLERLKNKLIENGYKSTYLVTDYPRETETDLEISEKCILFSDVNFLVFTKEGKRHGIIRELAFIATSEEMIDKAWTCVVFDQISEDGSSIPPLSMNDIRNTGIKRREFRTPEELENLALGIAFWYLKRLASVLQRKS